MRLLLFFCTIWIPHSYSTLLTIKSKEDEQGPYYIKITLHKSLLLHENAECCVSAKIYKNRPPRFIKQVKNRYTPYLQDTSRIRKMPPKKAFFTLLQNIRTSCELEKAISAIQTFDSSTCALDIAIAMLEKDECKKRDHIATHAEQAYGLIHHNAVIDWSVKTNLFLHF